MRTESDGGEVTAHRGPALVIARFEGRNRVRVTVVLAVLFSLFGAMYLWLGPQLIAGDAMQDLLDALPPVLNELFGFESLQSLEGLLASEYYTFGWLVGFGGYLAYSAATSISGDIWHDRMDTLLAGAVSRRSVLVGKFLALLVPIVALNVVVPISLFGMSVLIGSPLAIGDLALVHLLSIPYLLLWGSIGLCLGVVIRGGRTAGRLAIGLVFAGWFFDSLIGITDYDWLTEITPMGYFDPPDILVHGNLDPLGGVVLLVAAVGLVAASTVWFDTHDV